MSWQLLILVQTLLVGSSMICYRILARNKKTAKSSFAINAVVYTSLYLTFIIMLPFIGHVDTGVFREYWWRFILGGLAFALTNIFTYKTLVYFDAAIATIVGTINTIFTILGAGLVLDEKLSTMQLFGSIILISGISYGVLATHSVKKRTVAKAVKIGLFYALLAGLSFAIAAVNEKSLLEHMSNATYSVFGVGGQFGMAIIVALIFQPKKIVKIIKTDAVLWAFLAGILRGFGGLCFIFAEVRSNNVALVSVITNFRLIVVIFMGWWLLKERDYIMSKFISAFVSISGLIVMFRN